MTARPLPTRPGLLSRFWRSLRVRWLLRQAEAIKAERLQYEAAGAIGRVYRLNSILAELEKRMAASRLELDR